MQRLLASLLISSLIGCGNQIPLEFAPLLAGLPENTTRHIYISSTEDKSAPCGFSQNLVLKCNITIAKRCAPMWKSVLWHEVGHCNGLSHSDTPEDIMYHSPFVFESYPQSSIERFLSNL